MKTTILSLLAATLLGFAFGSSAFVALAFAAGLVAWTIDQYRREPRALMLARPIHLPSKPAFGPRGAAAGRHAA